MRTTDFSRAPTIGQAGAEFVGATSFRHPLALIGLYRRWRPVIRQLKVSPGYCGHQVWFRLPLTLGTVAFFRTMDDLLDFGRTPEHADLMQWVMRPGNARGGFIRFWEVRPHGYSSGMWRAEPPHLMKAIERYTPHAGEEDPPTVAERAALKR